MRARAFLLFALMSPAGVSAQTSVPHAIVFDSYMTPAAGAQSLLALQNVVTSAEDRWLPREIGDERSRHGRALGILYRSGKFFGLDMPQDHFLLVFAHEVFGHGARFRELGDGRLRYGFDVPIPYGSGGAVTKFDGLFPITPIAELAVSAAGIEAQHSLADSIAERAIARGRLHYREAWLYFESRMAAVSYIRSASPTSPEGHDVADYLEAFERACAPPCVPLTRHDAQRHALVALADPLLYYSVYGLAVSYIGQRQTTGPVPLIPTGGGVRIMPSLGYALTPYGEEWTLRMAWQRQRRTEGRGQREEGREWRITNVAMRIGNTGASSTWGITAKSADVRLWRLRTTVTLDAWRQPDLLAQAVSGTLETGGGALAMTVLPLPRLLRSPWSDSFQIAAGYKTRGYVPGEQLSRGAVLRAGITMSPR